MGRAAEERPMREYKVILSPSLIMRNLRSVAQSEIIDEPQGCRECQECSLQGMAPGSRGVPGSTFLCHVHWFSVSGAQYHGVAIGSGREEEEGILLSWYPESAGFPLAWQVVRSA